MALLHLQLLDKPEMCRTRYAVLFHPHFNFFFVVDLLFFAMFLLYDKKELMNA